MSNLPEIASLWIGGRLSWLEQLCLKSFADAGHHTTLYSYEEIPNIPEGVHAGDAAEIFPAEPMYRHARTGSPAIHADLWRLNLLKKTDKIWVDADMYCYRPFNFTRQSVFGWEKEGLVCNAVLGLPRESQALNAMLEFFGDEYAIGPWLKPWQRRELEAERDAGRPVHFTEQEWGFTGPAAVTYFLQQSGEIKYAEPVEAFYPVTFKQRNHMIMSKFDIEERLTPQTRGVHFWARRMKPRLEEKENNRPRRGSFMAGLIEKHRIDVDEALIPARKTPVNRDISDNPELARQIGADFQENNLSLTALVRKYAVDKQFVKKSMELATSGAPETAGAASKATSIGDSGLSYSEIITSQGIQIPYVPEIITPKIERPMRNNRYEGGECQHLRNILQTGDRVLDIGAGVGLVSSLAARTDGVEKVVAIEANPDLLPLIGETYRLNDVKNAELRNGVVSPTSGQDVTFYLRADFWASSMEPDSRPYKKAVHVPGFAIGDLIEEISPTIISCDIEGAELGLFDDVDLSGVRHMVLELHPKVYGEEGVRAIIDGLSQKGFDLSPDNTPGGSVHQFDRVEEPAKAPEELNLMPSREFRPWPVKNPKILAVTCMKDEGPFILEWIAWNKAVGITDTLVFTNDCTDGTDLLLDRLDEMGLVHHLPNPALATGYEHLQPAALTYAHFTKEYRDADFVLSFDVDEFLNIRVGKGRLQDLFSHLGEFDVLSISEVNHGSNNQKSYQRGWVTDQFPRHESETPGKARARRGIKSIVRMSEKIRQIRNHRPDADLDQGNVRWLDGSGKPFPEVAEDAGENGADCRGRYELVVLNHYPLRSLESYMMKMVRGDVVIKGKQVSQRYWRLRNRHDSDSSAQANIAASARREYNKLLRDKKLRALHDLCCQRHEDKIRAMENDPAIVERREWIMENCWDEPEKVDS